MFKGKTNTVWSICIDHRFNFSFLPRIILHRKHFVSQSCGHRAASSIWPLVRCILYHFIIFCLWYTNSQFKFLKDFLLFIVSKEEKQIIFLSFYSCYSLLSVCIFSCYRSVSFTISVSGSFLLFLLFHMQTFSVSSIHIMWIV